MFSVVGPTPSPDVHWSGIGHRECSPCRTVHCTAKFRHLESHSRVEPDVVNVDRSMLMGIDSAPVAAPHRFSPTSIHPQPYSATHSFRNNSLSKRVSSSILHAIHYSTKRHRPMHNQTSPNNTNRQISSI